MRIRSILCLAALLPTATLAAQSHGADMSIGVRFGTLGIGPEISKLVTSHVGLRAAAYFFSLSRTINQSGISFDANLKMKGLNGLVDLYPGARGSFHLTGGVTRSTALRLRSGCRDWQAHGGADGDGCGQLSTVKVGS